MQHLQCKHEISDILTHPHTHTHALNPNQSLLMVCHSSLSYPKGLCLCVCGVACQLPTSLQTQPPSSAHQIHTHTHARTSLSPIQLCRTLSKTSAQSRKPECLKYFSQNANFRTHPVTDHTASCT